MFHGPFLLPFRNPSFGPRSDSTNASHPNQILKDCEGEYRYIRHLGFPMQGLTLPTFIAPHFLSFPGIAWRIGTHVDMNCLNSSLMSKDLNYSPCWRIPLTFCDFCVTDVNFRGREYPKVGFETVYQRTDGEKFIYLCPGASQLSRSVSKKALHDRVSQCFGMSFWDCRWQKWTKWACNRVI